MLQEGITALEALGIAIRNEIDAQALYQDLASLTKDEVLKERFLNLQQEERRHRLLLEKKYKEMFPHVDLQLPPSQLPVELGDEGLSKKHSLKDVLEIAINAEKEAREFYLDCAETNARSFGKTHVPLFGRYAVFPPNDFGSRVGSHRKISGLLPGSQRLGS